MTRAHWSYPNARYTMGVGNPNQWVMVGVVISTAGIGRIPVLRVLLIRGMGGLNSGHHHPD
ncbi:hypothetical protein CRG98_048420 [Punica granatum]|uniref:Uncharacterized protein n=1 Tax=Punica granatum TaxID=22663 RepID=A0A2I0HHK9_PUNGR|nr:hypothetical protein CRG98_048420 [Punica granatum]